MKNNQSGRSMIEMLCVLGIIGLLTVGALSGYRTMITKYYANKTAEYMSMLVTQLKTTFAPQENYDGLSAATLLNLGVLPAEFGTDPAKIASPYGGLLNAYASNRRKTDGMTDPNYLLENTSTAAVLELGNISSGLCRLLMTADWGNQIHGGIIAIVASNETGTFNGGHMNANGTSGAPTTYASNGAKGSGEFVGADKIYLDADLNTMLNKKGNDKRNTMSYGIPGHPKYGIPVNPVEVTRGCSCFDPKTQEEYSKCSFAIKFY